MTQIATLQFAHRLNEDGSIDTICRECFITVATAAAESVLVREERKHICEPASVERYKKRRDREEFS
jgi:hypothetical protein